MFKNIFLKTLYEKRWLMLLWFLGVVAMTLLTLAFYPSFKGGGFDEVFKNAPKSLQSLLGDTASLKTVPGYVAQQIFALRIPMLVLIMGVVLFGSLLAGDENEGTLQTLLTQPVSRNQVFIQKFMAGAVTSLVVCSGGILGVLLALLLIHEQMSFIRLVESTLDVWLLVILFGTLAYALGAITGKRSVAGGATGLIAFASYLLTSLKPNVSALEPFERLSPFHYYNNPATAVNGLNWPHVLGMIVVIAMVFTASLVVFNRRDIYQH